MQKPKVDRETGFAVVDSRFLWALQPFVAYSRANEPLRFAHGNIIVEPCAHGGAMVIGVCGAAMAVFRDPDGHCSRPMSVSVPDDLFAAATPPEPVRFQFENDGYECPLPEWAQPGELYLYHVGCHLGAKMRHPDWAEMESDFQPALFQRIECGNVHHVGRDYKWSPKVSVDWRHVLRLALKAKDQQPASSCFSPDIVALFARARRLFPCADGAWPRLFTREADGRQFLVTIEGAPNFIGCFMSMNEGPYQEPPNWFDGRLHDEVGHA